MRTLIIEPGHGFTLFRAKGLSIKSSGLHVLCRNEMGYFISNDLWSQYDGRTAQISTKYLIEILAELYSNFKFDNIKIDGHYELTGEQLMSKLLKLSI